MPRFVVVLPLVPLVPGDEFTVADWPLHVTLVEPFLTDVAVADLAAAVSRIAGSAAPVRASAGEEAMFGRRRDVPVTLVRDGGELAALRSGALDALREAGVDLDRIRARSDFRPHVTRKRHAYLVPGEHISLDTLALIDMRPAEGAHHRSVIASWRLGDRDSDVSD
ncbi:2'-5' RNA ligase family protein [Agromyces sp. NPDC058484]|uniref:2'-5' RNA ligase family protein n=1 Tax=Agromyces sp. NPDC058484 TaxID=3346524 RepID=UPI00365D59D8